MFRNFFIISLLLLTIFAVGCGESEKDPITTDNNNENNSSTNLGKQFYVRVGQTESIDSGNIKVKLTKVTDDSRCPSDVVCIWAGEVKVMLDVTIDNQDFGETILTLGASIDERAVKNVGGYFIKVLAVNPYPVSTKTLEQKDYIVTLIVSKTIDESAC